MEQSWLQLKNAYNESAEAVLGEREGSSLNGLGVETYRRMDERRQTKDQLGRVRSERLKEHKREEYRRKDKEVKATAGADEKNGGQYCGRSGKCSKGQQHQ